MPDLSTFQDDFCAALEGQPHRLRSWLGDDREPAGLSVYQNTVVKGCVDALAGIYGTVLQLVGEDWFRAASIEYVRGHPPAGPSLLDYGAAFPHWLSEFPPAEDAPYLAKVARLEWLCNEAYFAADAESLSAKAFGGLGERDLARHAAKLHPSARLASFDQNIVGLWLAHRPPGDGLEDFQLVETTDQALVIRRDFEIEVRPLGDGAYGFLTACSEGASLLEAAERAFVADASADLPRIIADAFELGAFSALVSTSTRIQAS